MVVDPCFVYEDEKHLTVSKTSVFFANDGYTTYDDCRGQLLFRVDSYGPDARDRGELVLMDIDGRCLLTLRRKWPSLHSRWEGFAGERKDADKPVFCVRRSSIIGRSAIAVDVAGDEGDGYLIAGLFATRSCKIYDSASKQPVAEIRRKVDATTGVVLSKDVFSLIVKPGFDSAFAMGLVLVLDQITGDGDLLFHELSEQPPSQD